MATPPVVNGRFTPKFFEGFGSNTLADIRANLELVLDERARQFDLFTVPPLQAPAAQPAPQPAATPMLDVAGILSPSQCRSWMDCQAKWMFHYLLDLPETRNGNLALGIAFHAAVGAYFRHRILERGELPVDAVLKLFQIAWEEQCQETEFRDDENPEDIAAAGAGLVAKYITEAAPAIAPAAVEQKVDGEIGGVRVTGYVDLVDTSGTIVELKTAKARPSGIKPDHRFQLAIYRQLTPGANGEVRIDTLVRTKTPQLIQTPYTVSECDVQMTRTLLPLAQEGMRSGLYYPNRLSMMCSRRNCSYWRQCEKEFGGEIEEA